MPRHHVVDDEQRLVIRLRDVSEREQQSRALDQARRRFQQAFQSAPTGMALVRLDDGRIVDANQSLAEMLRRDVDDLVGCTLREFTHPDDVRTAQPHRARLELGIVDSYRIDQRYRRRDGEYVWARTRVSSTEDDGVMLAITHIEDVTEQRRAAEQLRYAARHDELTGLPNRSYLMHLLHDRLATAEIGEVAVLFVDLDHFKTINDSLGHEVGDQLLQVVSERLRTVLREHDVLARFGGDEFIVVMQGEPVDVADRLRKAVHAPVDGGRARALRHRLDRLLHEPRARACHPTTCCVTPTPPCTAPRRVAATASKHSRSAGTRPACRRCAPPASCGAGSSGARWSRTSSRSSSSPRGG